MAEVGLNPELLRELAGIDWFSACGTPAAIPGAMAVKNAAEAKKTIASTRWENMILDKRGDFTVALCLRATRGEGQEDRLWNSIVIEWKEKHLPGLQKLWEQRLEPLGLREKQVIDDLQFNMAAIVTIDAYREIFPMPEFFGQLLDIYRRGYLACGWKGKKDKGCFLVY